MRDFLLILSAVITVIGIVPYMRDILRGTTKPNIASWTTWCLLFLIATVAELAAHEFRTAFFTSAVTLETGLIVILGFKYGYAKYTKLDFICQIGALSGFFVWWLFNNPLAALVLVIFIDLLSCIPTIEHSWFSPREETWITFAISGLGSFVAIFALNSFNLASLAYPVYLVFINILITSVIVFRQQTMKLNKK